MLQAAPQMSATLISPSDWNKLFADYKAKNPEKAQLWQDFLDKKLPENLEALLPKFGPEKPIATRNAGGDILKVL